MTNAQKYEEVFGFPLNTSFCPAEKCKICPMEAETCDCDKWWDSEYKEPDNKSHAKYIRHVNDNGHNIADCSVCGHAMQWHDEDEDGVPRFCWFCGAKIDNVED